MTTEINNLFAAEVNSSASNNTRGLSGTAQLTSIANERATLIINEMNADIEMYTDDIKSSQVDNNAMDKLIAKVAPLDDIDIDFLKELDEQTVEGMLKSQQSKRSRCKSKAMTLDNYKSLMSAGIAEGLIRLATGKAKSAAGSRRAAGAVEYTIEQLEQLSNDQEALRREIRNVQSKKSIMKSKADFDETCERYQSLLKVEQQLKDMRVGTAHTVVEVDTTKNAVSELLEDIDLEHIKAADSKELLARIAAMVGNVNLED